MIKKVLKILFKVVKILSIISLIVIFTISIIENDAKINRLAEIVDGQIAELHNRCNEILDNEIELLKKIQEGKIDTIELAKLINKEADINKLLNSSVFVKTFFGEGGGTVINKSNNRMYILTCYHVVKEIYELNQGGFSLNVSVGYSKKDNRDSIAGMMVYSAEIIKVDETNDLALLRTSIVDDNLLAATLAKNEPEKGDTVYSVGSPLGIWRTVSKGIIANKQDEFYFSDNTITFGNSGGGLYNVKGELIGVPSNVMGYGSSGNFVPESGLGLSISLFRIKEFLKGVEY